MNNIFKPIISARSISRNLQKVYAYFEIVLLGHIKTADVCLYPQPDTTQLHEEVTKLCKKKEKRMKYNSLSTAVKCKTKRIVCSVHYMSQQSHNGTMKGEVYWREG